MAKSYPKAQNPLLLRYHRLLDAFSKSDDERDFYLDKIEGFIFYADLDKGLKELEELEREVKENSERYCLIPKMTYYETKKFMEGFVNEKVYDIDTKEKLLDIIQSKEARENFLEFIYDHLNELEKWQLYYHERSRIRIIEWLRLQQVQFVFEEDLELNKVILEKLKTHLFDAKPPKELIPVREALFTKAKTYYSNEALNPRPKRGRPPKQVAKVEVEPQFTSDIYTMVPAPLRSFLYLPEIVSASSVTFSARFDTEAQLLASLRGSARAKVDVKLQALSERLESLRHLSTRLGELQGLAGVDKKEEKLFKAVSRAGETEEKKEAPKIAGVVKGVLPRKEGRIARPLEHKEGEERKRPPVKMVTPLPSKKGKK